MNKPTTFLDGRVKLHAGDCLDVLKSLPAASVDSVVCDPPYHLTTGKKGGSGLASLNENSPAGRARISTGGFMGKAWDGGDIAFQVATWEAVLRVLKPGGHLVAFSGTRTYHRMVCAIEDAGFEIRDQIGWAYGSGFPKSHDVSKGIDARLTSGRSDSIALREVNETRPGEATVRPNSLNGHRGIVGAENVGPSVKRDTPATEAAKQWEGWGTALKPAWEPIVLARKPLIGTVAENVLQHGTGAINVDGCRVDYGGLTLEEVRKQAGSPTIVGTRAGTQVYGQYAERVGKPIEFDAKGRWPANLIHDGSEEVQAAFPDAPGQQGDITGSEPSEPAGGNVYGAGYRRKPVNARRDGEASAGRRYTEDGATNFAVLPGARRDAAGSAARFFYTSKADSEDRLGSKHPTVKPVDLMQWLVRLVTPKGGTCLDPFAGTGTTGEAAWREGMNAILIECEEEYQADIARRMVLATNPTKRAAVAKTKNNTEAGSEDLPLFQTRN